MAYGYNANHIPPSGLGQLTTQNVQPLFPQPQGNVYQINSTLEVANVPVGAFIKFHKTKEGDYCRPPLHMEIVWRVQAKPRLF